MALRWFADVAADISRESYEDSNEPYMPTLTQDLEHVIDEDVPPAIDVDDDVPDLMYSTYPSPGTPSVFDSVPDLMPAPMDPVDHAESGTPSIFNSLREAANDPETIEDSPPVNDPETIQDTPPDDYVATQSESSHSSVTTTIRQESDAEPCQSTQIERSPSRSRSPVRRYWFNRPVEPLGHTYI